MLKYFANKFDDRETKDDPALGGTQQEFIEAMKLAA